MFFREIKFLSHKAGKEKNARTGSVPLGCTNFSQLLSYHHLNSSVTSYTSQTKIEFSCYFYNMLVLCNIFVRVCQTVRRVLGFGQ